VNSDKAGWVSIDNRAAACEAMETLMEMGHEDILIIAGKKNADVNTVRMQGVQDALENRGMRLAQLTRLYCDFSAEIAYEKTLLYLKTKKKKRPTAIFCFSDIMALGVMRALRECALSIPQDISLMGFDGLQLCDVTVPTLSTVEQDRMEIGYAAAEMLHEIMDGRCHGGHRVLPYDVVLRESVQELKR
ncbi:MAG: substrate-binding domain-containing protein, partial [Clostridia bacterium]|nr:substrate-binding domain-containing protein [Clostridia bacterium]